MDSRFGDDVWKQWELVNRGRYQAMLMQLLQCALTGRRGQALEEWQRLVRQYDAQNLDNQSSLIPGTDLRPADILTSALGNAYTALDVSICSPHASEAGADCTQSRVQAKHQYYGPHLDSLLRQNISYCPVVWSAYGRPHPDTLAVLRSLSKSIARKRNVASVRFAPAGQRLLLWWTWIWLPSPCWGSAVAPGFPLLLRFCSVSIGSAVSAPWYLVSGRTPALRFC